MGTVFHRTAVNPVRFANAPGRQALRACFILGLATLVGTASAVSATDTATAVRQAQTRFEAGDLSGASALLDRASVKGADDRALADVANLRGAIALRRQQYGKAKEAFSKAAAHDPNLWAARFNSAEVSFRRGDYAEASKQFEALVAQTQGVGSGEERRLAQYKHLLAASMEGKEKSTRDFLAAHRGEQNPPLEYYYLNAALEQKRGHTQKAGQWLAQAGTKHPAGTGGVYAESFQRLGWPTADSGRLVAMVNGQSASPASATTTPEVSTKAKPASKKTPAETPRDPENIAAPKPEFRLDPETPIYPVFREHGPTTRDVNGQMPPLVDARQPQTLVEDAAGQRTGMEAPAVLGKPSSGRRPKTTPTPSATPSTSPEATTSTGGSPAPAASATPSASPSASPLPAFVQKYEAAYVKYLEKDFPAAKALVEEAEAIQPGQKNASDLRDLIFKSYYEGAYVSFRKGDYPTALEQLGNADGVKPNNPDALNLRGLVFSRQRNYEQAESSFKKASQLDPTFYAAKFNYAELPFNYRNYTVARSRFEELFGQTDATKQPVEAEITQFKVFLTLLLEGKLDAARSFMDHFNFTGATPARYFCQASLDFYGGNMEKAQGWVDSAGREFKPQLVSIFKESFYRIGWMIDQNGTPTLAGRPTLPEASPAASVPAVASATASPSASPAAVLAMNSPVPAASVPPGPGASPAIARASVTPAPTVAVAVVTPTPAVVKASVTPAPAVAVAASSASPSVTPIPVVAKASVSPAPTAALAVSSASPSATPALVVVKASPTPTPVAVAASSASPSATPTPAVVRASATPLPTVAVVAAGSASPSATPAPTVARATASPVPAASAKPIPSVAGATPAVVQVTPTPESTPSEEASDEENSQSELPIQLLIIGFVVISTVSSLIVVQRAKAQRQARLRARRNAPAHSDREEALKTEEAQTPR